MNTKFLLIVLLNLFVFNLKAQDKKYWSDERLKISDFEGSPIGSVPFQLKYDIEISKKRQKIEKTTHVHYQARAIVVPSQSWIIDDSLKTLRLRYCNLVFDFVELYARRFDDEINVINLDFVSYQESKNNTIATLNDAISQVSNHTKIGTDRKQIETWENYIDSMLRVTFRKEIPDFRYNNLTLLISAGAAYNHFTGALADQFSSPVSVSNVFYVSWKRVNYSVGMTYYGSVKPSKSYFSVPEQFGDSARFKLTYNTITVGYELIKKPQFLLTPYAGMSTMRFAMLKNDASPKKYTDPLKASINVGLAMDLRSKAFFQVNKAQFRYGLGLRANYSPYNYLPKLRGNCLSFSVTFGIYLDHIKNYL